MWLPMLGFICLSFFVSGLCTHEGFSILSYDICVRKMPAGYRLRRSDNRILESYSKYPVSNTGLDIFHADGFTLSKLLIHVFNIQQFRA